MDLTAVAVAAAHLALVEVYTTVELEMLFLRIAPYHQIWLSEEGIQMDLQMEEISRWQETLERAQMAAREEQAVVEQEEMRQVIILVVAEEEALVDLEEQEALVVMAAAAADVVPNQEEALRVLVD